MSQPTLLAAVLPGVLMDIVLASTRKWNPHPTDWHEVGPQVEDPQLDLFNEPTQQPPPEKRSEDAHD